MIATMLSVFMGASALLAEAQRRTLLPLDAIRLNLIFLILVYFAIPAVLPLSYACAPYCAGVPLLPRVVAAVGLGSFVVGACAASLIPVVRVTPTVQFDDGSVYRVALAVLTLAAFALMIYARSYGGLVEAMAYGALQRFTRRDIVDVQGTAVALYFVNMASIVVAVAQYRLYTRPLQRGRYAVLLAGAIAVVIVYGLIHASRGVVFNIVLLMLVIDVSARRRPWSIGRLFVLGSVLITGVWFAAYGKNLIGATAAVVRGASVQEAYGAVERRDVDYVFGRAIAEFSHPIISLGVVTERGVDHNYMRHFVVAPLHLIPTRLMGMSGARPYRVTETNTEALTGSASGGIPPGLFASLWYGGGLAGVVGGCVLFGAMVALVQRQAYAVIRVYPVTTPIAIYAFFRIAWFVNNGDPSVFLKHVFHLIALSLLLAGYYLYRRVTTVGLSADSIAGQELQLK